MSLSHYFFIDSFFYSLIQTKEKCARHNKLNKLNFVKNNLIYFRPKL